MDPSGSPAAGDDSFGCDPRRALNEANARHISRLYGRRVEAYVHGFPAWDANLRDFDEVSAAVVTPAANIWTPVVFWDCPGGAVGWAQWWGSDATDVLAFQNVQWRITCNNGVYAGPFPALAQLNTLKDMSALHIPLGQGQRVQVEAYRTGVTEYSVIARIKGVFHRETGEKLN